MATDLVRMIQRRDSAANWQSFDPVLASGEFGYDTTTRRVKIGDGTTQWTGLRFIDADPSDADPETAALLQNSQSATAGAARTLAVDAVRVAAADPATPLRQQQDARTADAIRAAVQTVSLFASGQFSGQVRAHLVAGSIVLTGGGMNRGAGFSNAFTTTGVVLPVGMRPVDDTVTGPAATAFNGHQYQYQVRRSDGAVLVRMLEAGTGYMAFNVPPWPIA